MSALIPVNIPSLRLVRNRPVRVYLCGPIAENCWRHRLVPGLREAFCANEDERARALCDVVTELPTITSGIVCNGPWFVSCDHGCAHGQGTHGAGENECSGGPRGAERRSCVFEASIERIRRADAVFAYFDRKEAYGSATEIGVAMALGKPIFVGFVQDAGWQDDLWFAAHAGFGSEAGHVGPVEVLWAKFCLILDVAIKLRKLT